MVSVVTGTLLQAGPSPKTPGPEPAINFGVSFQDVFSQILPARLADEPVKDRGEVADLAESDDEPALPDEETDELILPDPDSLIVPNMQVMAPSKRTDGEVSMKPEGVFATSEDGPRPDMDPVARMSLPNQTVADQVLAARLLPQAASNPAAIDADGLTAQAAMAVQQESIDPSETAAPKLSPMAQTYLITAETPTTRDPGVTPELSQSPLIDTRPDPLVPEVVPDFVVDLSVHVSRDARLEQNAATPLNVPKTMPADPREIVRHISEKLLQSDQNRVEITLTPEELGKVRLVITPGDVPSVSVYADNRETLELLRRNADLLSKELRDTGFAGASLSFGDSNQSGQRTPNDAARQEMPENRTALPTALTPGNDRHPALPTGRQLDMRI